MLVVEESIYKKLCQANWLCFVGHYITNSGRIQTSGYSQTQFGDLLL